MQNTEIHAKQMYSAMAELSAGRAVDTSASNALYSFS